MSDHITKPTRATASPRMNRFRIRLFAGLVTLLSPLLAHADPLPIDYRCGSGISLAAGAPVDGWTRAANGRLPGKAGNPCWLRIDISALAPRVLELSGADGYKGVTLFDAGGKPLAVAHDYGERHNAIVGSGAGSGSMLFPALQTGSTPIYARVERSRYTVVVAAVDVSAAIQSERDYDFLHSVSLPSMRSSRWWPLRWPS